MTNKAVVSNTGIILKLNETSTLISDKRNNNIVKSLEKIIITLLKVVIGVVLICGGYYAAMMVGDMSSFIYIFYAVVLVVAGIYFLYNGVIPFVIKKLAQNKSYLYQKERSLWVNNLAFRLKKNYRAYAMVTIILF